MTKIRESAVAGLFYPADSAALSDAVDRCMSERVRGARAARVMVVPHAGLPYSGCVAATAYAALEDGRRPSRVAVLGPPHRLPVDGVATSSATAFATPGGLLSVAYPDALWTMPDVCVSDDAHLAEHCIEVQLPFLQRIWGNTPTLAPLLVGDTEATVVADIIELLLADADTLVLISSDLSHFHGYDSARRIDAATVAVLEASSGTLGPEQACGCRALNGLLEYCRRNDRHLHALDVRNSGDTAGGRDRVVGYAALALS